MTLGDVVEYDGGSSAFNTARRSFTPRVGDAGTASAAGDAASSGDPAAPDAATAATEADRSIAEDGTDLLSAYIARRHASFPEG
jgi:hypothetical protein